MATQTNTPGRVVEESALVTVECGTCHKPLVISRVAFEGIMEEVELPQEVKERKGKRFLDKDYPGLYVSPYAVFHCDREHCYHLACQD